MVERYSAFVSHSWHASKWIKLTALFVHFNGAAAAAVGVGLGLLFRIEAGLVGLGAWREVVRSEFPSRWIPCLPDAIHNFNMWGVVGFSLGYWWTLLYWQAPC